MALFVNVGDVRVLVPTVETSRVPVSLPKDNVWVTETTRFLQMSCCLLGWVRAPKRIPVAPRYNWAVSTRLVLARAMLLMRLTPLLILQLLKWRCLLVVVKLQVAKLSLVGIIRLVGVMIPVKLGTIALGVGVLTLCPRITI